MQCDLITHRALRSSQELVHKCMCIPGSNLNLEMLVFDERERQEYKEKKHFQSEVENQHQTQSTYMYDMGSRNGTRDTLVVGTCSRHFTISAPQ